MQRRLITLLVVLMVGTGTAAAATTAPRNTVRPTISGTARPGEVLTADPGTWTGTQTITFAYQWRRCDTNGANCSNIIGATSKTYTLTSVDLGNKLRVRVRASNSVGSRSVVSLPTPVVTAQPPKSLSLHAGQSVVVYGRAVSLFGSLANGQVGDAVTINERPIPSFSGVDVRTVATVQTSTDGSFNAAVRPASRAQYRASNGQATSNTVTINVRPRLSLRRIGLHRFAVTATAARSFLGRYGVVQRLRHHRWVSMRRVFFTRALPGVSPLASRAVFRARLGGSRIRVFVPSSQVSPGYVSGVTNVTFA